MLTAIMQHSEELIAFITALNIALYQPQIRHLIQMADGLLTSNETKTISRLYRLLKGNQIPRMVRTFYGKVLGNRQILDLPESAGW